MTSFDPDLLNILVCPKTHKPLEYDQENQVLISRAAGLVYPIKDGIPLLLLEDAKPLEES